MNKIFPFIAGVETIRTKRHVRKKFPREDLYMRGKHATSGRNKSVLYFTVHRCASRYVAKILKQVVTNDELTYIDLAGYLWHGGKIYGNGTGIYENYGYVYGPFYGLDKEELEIPVPDYDDFRILLMLRDPRDVLTSYYFHHAFHLYSNPARQEFINERSRSALSKTIDEWVIGKMHMFKERYKTYIEKFYGKPNVMFIKYEDMILDFRKWLQELVEFMNIHPLPKVMESIGKQADFTVKRENAGSHKRQVTPGDHVRKLSTETVNVLNSEFGEILAQLGYGKKAP